MAEKSMTSYDCIPCQTCTVFKRSNAYSVLAALRQLLYSTRVVGCKGRGSHLGCMSSGFEGRRHRFPQISTPHDIQSGRYRFSSMLPTATEKWVVGFARMASAKICGTTGRSALVGAPTDIWHHRSTIDGILRYLSFCRILHLGSRFVSVAPGAGHFSIRDSPASAGALVETTCTLSKPCVWSQRSGDANVMYLNDLKVCGSQSCKGTCIGTSCCVSSCN